MKPRPVLGLTELVTFIGNNGQRLEVQVRIDSGATSSSMDKELAERLGLSSTTRTKKIRSASGVEQRPIIHAKVEINGTELEAEFSIADRRHMTYDALIGQNILKQGKFIVDPLKESVQGSSRTEHK